MGMKERETIMNRYTVFYILLLACLIICSTWAVFRWNPDTIVISIISVAMIFPCVGCMIFVRSVETKALTEKYALKMERTAHQRDMQLKEIVLLMGWVYETENPTNETMRSIRTRLFDCMIDTLRDGASVKIVKDYGQPDAIRDLVQRAIKLHVLDLSKGEKWMAEFVQFALADKLIEVKIEPMIGKSTT